jgi:predicted RNase H-like nuclease (RuvC/YqgF family)
MADDLESLTQRTLQELARLAAEEKAYKQKISALEATENELKSVCDELQDKLAGLKAEYDAQLVARKFVEFCETRLDNLAGQLNGKPAA